MTNLVDNAIKYTPEGQITLSAERLDQEKVKITVADTGVGIPKAVRQLIFEAFQQAKP